MVFQEERTRDQSLPIEYKGGTMEDRLPINCH